MNRRQALRMLVKSVQSNPTQKEWDDATSAMFRGLWPDLMNMPRINRDRAIASSLALVGEARSIASRRMSDTASGSSSHQAAVNALVELSLTSAGMQGTSTVPIETIPALFRAAVQEAKAMGPRNRYCAETDLIELALMLIDRSGGEAKMRTPDQEELYAALQLSFDEGQQVRIEYSPREQSTIH